jgi:hypothetical protein
MKHWKYNLYIKSSFNCISNVLFHTPTLIPVANASNCSRAKHQRQNVKLQLFDEVPETYHLTYGLL